MMILFLVLVGFAVYYFVKNHEHTEDKSSKKDSIELLKLRFVNGEIDEETYKRTLEVLILFPN